MPEMNITAYVINDKGDKLFNIEPATKTRNWMDQSSGKFAYNCLPLVVANQLGWVIKASFAFSLTWNGQAGQDAIKFSFDQDQQDVAYFVASHFGQGIISFKLPWIFRTDPGIGLIVRGPSNRWLPGIHPLEGFVESWGLESTFTMNWKVVNPDTTIHFPANFPICQILPYEIATLSNYSCTKMPIAKNKELALKYSKWLDQRSKTIKNLLSDKNTTGYFEKDYVKGVNIQGEKVDGHLKNINLSKFE